jgi:hypothetical protein
MTDSASGDGAAVRRQPTPVLLRRMNVVQLRVDAGRGERS